MDPQTQAHPMQMENIFRWKKSFNLVLTQILLAAQEITPLFPLFFSCAQDILSPASGKYLPSFSVSPSNSHPVISA